MVTNVKSKWVDGDLYFYDKSENEIFHVDGTNRALVLPSGAVFSCASLNLDTTEMGLLDGATAGSITASKVVSRDASQGIPLATLVVAVGSGTTQGNGTALTKDINLVTGANSSKAVVLPTAAIGQSITIVNTAASATLPVFPATGAAINGGSANAAFTIGPARAATFICTALLTWYAELAAAGTSTVAEQNTLTGIEATAAELNLLHDVVGGTVSASKAIAANAQANIGVVKCTAFHLGTSGSETQVTASGAELNYLDVTTLGNAEASKALTFDALTTARIGDFVAAGAKGSAVAFAITQAHYADGQLDLLSGFGESNSDLTAAYSAKVGRFRHLVSNSTAEGTTAISVAHETYGLVGQLVAKNATMTHLHGGLMGTFEGNTAGVVAASSYSVAHAGVIGRVGGHSTITATTPVAGVLAFNNGTAGLGSGISVGFATSQRDSSYPWSVGLYVPRGSIVQGVRIGGFALTGSLGSAIVFSGTTDSADATQLDIVACYGESASNLGVGISAKVGRFRHLVNVTTCAHETYGVVGQLVAKGSTLTHLHGGVMGTFEGNTSGVVLNSSYAVAHAGVIGRVGGHSTITATTPVAGVLAFNNGTAALAGATSCYGFAVAVRDTTYPWTTGLFMADSAMVTGINIGTCTTSIVAVSPATFTGAAAANGIIYANTSTAAVGAGAVRAIVGALSLFASTTSGTVVGVRGSVTATTAITGTIYAYGVQGKVILDSVNVTAGSGHVCAVMAQISGSGMTATSGHIAGLIVSGQTLPASANVNMIYIETGGATINSAIQFNCRSTYLFDINNFESCGIVATAGTGANSAGVSTGAVATRVLKVFVDGVAAYIPLCSTNT